MITQFIESLQSKWEDLQKQYNCRYTLNPVTVEEYLRREKHMRRKNRWLTISYYPYARCHYDGGKPKNKAWVYLFTEKLNRLTITPNTFKELVDIFTITLRHEMGHCLVYRHLFETASDAERNAYFDACDADWIQESVQPSYEQLLAYEMQTSEQTANAAVGLTTEELMSFQMLLEKFIKH